MAARLARSFGGAGCALRDSLLPSITVPLEGARLARRPSTTHPRKRRCYHLRHSSSSSAPSSFSAQWNDALSRRPQEAVACFLSAQSTTWLAFYALLSSASSISLPPELAAGWMIARLTKKVRQPANALLAAGAVAACPSLKEMKVTPLVTGFAADANTKTQLIVVRQRLEDAVPGARGAMDAAARGAAWLEGPVDRYGLAFYLSGKVTSLSTMWALAYLIHQGFDLQSALSGWGLGAGVGTAVGTIAGAATCNAFLTPLHFAAVVGGVHGMESTAAAFRRAAPEGVLEELWEKGRMAEERARIEGYDVSRDQGETGEQNEDEPEEEEEEEETAEQFFENRFIDVAKIVLLMYSLAISMYALELMKETATGEADGGDESTEKSENIG